jgi:hypothetical protein
MKGLFKKSVGLLLVLAVCVVVLIPGMVQAADEDIPRTFKSAYVVTPDADEDIPRTFKFFPPITTNADEDIPRTFK